MTQVGPSVDWRLAVAIALLIAIAVGAAVLGRMSTGHFRLA
jgi:hypothetical protein